MLSRQPPACRLAAPPEVMPWTGVSVLPSQYSPAQAGRSGCLGGCAAGGAVLNQTSFIFGHDTYMALMHAFRHVYRQAVLQPIIVGLMLFQAASGLWLLRG